MTLSGRKLSIPYLEIRRHWVPNMDSSKLNDWMQVVGIFALVASLIFVGLQINQTHQIATSNAYQNRIDTSIEMVTANAANEKGLAAWYRPQTEADLELLAPEEQWAGTQMSLGLLLAYDNIHFQFESGFISEEGWLPALADMKQAMTLPFFKRFMMSQLDRMRPSLRAVVVEINADLENEKDD